MTTTPPRDEIADEVTVTVRWARDGGLSLFVGDALQKSTGSEEEFALYFGGFLKAVRGNRRSITLDIEEHNKLLDYKDAYLKQQRQAGATRDMAQRLAPVPAEEPDDVLTAATPEEKLWDKAKAMVAVRRGR